MKKYIIVVIALIYIFLGVNMLFAGTWTKKADFGGAARYNAVGFAIGSKLLFLFSLEGRICAGFTGSDCRILLFCPEDGRNQGKEKETQIPGSVSCCNLRIALFLQIPGILHRYCKLDFWIWREKQHDSILEYPSSRRNFFLYFPDNRLHDGCLPRTS